MCNLSSHSHCYIYFSFLYGILCTFLRSFLQVTNFPLSILLIYSTFLCLQHYIWSACIYWFCLGTMFKNEESRLMGLQTFMIFSSFFVYSSLVFLFFKIQYALKSILFYPAFLIVSHEKKYFFILPETKRNIAFLNSD